MLSNLPVAIKQIKKRFYSPLKYCTAYFGDLSKTVAPPYNSVKVVWKVDWK